MSERVAAMTEIERAAWVVTLIYDQLSCDARNDAPWRSLRHGDIFRDALIDLGRALDRALGTQITEDEIDEVLGDG